MKKIVLILLLGIIESSLAQVKDTIYYNKYWGKTSRAKHSFYRLVPLKKEGDLFKIKDFYKNGTVQMVGFSKSNTKDIFEGKITWYYPSGNKSIERTYQNGVLHGELKTYFEDGKVKSIGQIKNDRNWSGYLPSYGNYWSGYLPSHGNGVYKTELWSEGKKLARFAYYKDTKTIAEKMVLPKEKEGESQRIFYDKKGVIISSVKLFNKRFRSAEIIEGTEQYFQLDKNFFVHKIIGEGKITIENTTKHILIKMKGDPKVYKGVYGEDRFRDGYFYEDGELAHYKKGEKEGKVWCCYNNTIIKTEGEFVGGKPYQGSFYDPLRRTITSFKKGRLDGKKIKYDRSYNIEKLLTYSDDIYNGPYQIKERNYFEKGFYKNDEKDGEIVFIDNYKNKYKCIYANGKPISGTNYNYITNETSEYHKGKRNGKYIRVFKDSPLYDSIVGQFKNGVPYGSFTNYKNQTKVSSAYYKDGKPYNGVFFKNKNFKKYENGELIEMLRNNFQYTIRELYKERKIKKRIISQVREKQTFVGVFLDGNPFSGQFFNMDTIKKYDYVYRFSSYENGVKDGKEIVFKYPFQDTISIKNYDKGLLHGNAVFRLRDSIYKGEYKYNKFYNGVFVEQKNGYNCFTKAEKGEIQFKSFMKSKTEKIEYSIEYKYGKPFEGRLLSFNDSKVFRSKNRVQEYEKGRLVRTFYGNYKFLNTNRVEHSSVIDTIYRFGTKIIINYRNKTKTSGEVIFLDGKKKQKGTIVFEEFKVVSSDYTLGGIEPERHYVDKDGNYVIEILMDDIKVNVEFIPNLKDDLYEFLCDFKTYSWNLPEVKMKYYQTSSSKLLATIIFKKGQPFNGRYLYPKLGGYRKGDKINDTLVMIIDDYKNGKKTASKKMTFKEYLDSL